MTGESEREREELKKKNGLCVHMYACVCVCVWELLSPALIYFYYTTTLYVTIRISTYIECIFPSFCKGLLRKYVRTYWGDLRTSRTYYNLNRAGNFLKSLTTRCCSRFCYSCRK